MNSLQVLLILLSSSFGHYIKPDCDSEDGHRIYVDCNTCYCQQGYIVNCTKYECHYFDREINCVENESKALGCHLCRCINEEWDCSKVLCQPRYLTEMRLKIFEWADKQEEIYKETHNVTWDPSIFSTSKKPMKREVCLDDNPSMENCTHPCNCTGELYFEDFLNISCAPGEQFKIECSICTCNLNGVGYICTKNPCERRELPGSHFPAGKKTKQIPENKQN